MSEENVAAIRRGIEAYVASDWEAWVAEFDPEITWEETPGLGPDPAIYRGVEEVRTAVSSWLEMWVDYDFEARQYIDAGDDVVVLAIERGRSRTGVGGRHDARADPAHVPRGCGHRAHRGGARRPRAAPARAPHPVSGAWREARRSGRRSRAARTYARRYAPPHR